MKYLKKFETYSQDMMSLPTNIKMKKSKINNAQDMMSLNTSITDENKNLKNILKPYYDFIKTIKGVSDISSIIYEKVDNLYGFSFIFYYNKIMLLSDKNSINILINQQLIPLKNTSEIIKIIENESI